MYTNWQVSLIKKIKRGEVIWQIDTNGDVIKKIKTKNKNKT